MGNIFSGSEIVKIGIQIEKNGKAFYETLLKQTRNPKAKEIYKYLAGEEAKHIIVFEDILEKTQDYEPVESYEGEYLAYMKDLASEYVFTQKDKGAQAARKIKNDLDAINTGIGFEKDSIIFYEGMKKIIPQYHQNTVSQLIIQEQGHLRQLVDLKHNIELS